MTVLGKRELSDAEHEQRVDAAKARWSDRFPAAAGMYAAAGTVVALGAGQDAVSLVRGHPGAPRRSLAELAHKPAISLQNTISRWGDQLKRVSPDNRHTPIKFPTMDEKTVRNWKLTGSTLVNGSQGVGPAKRRFKVGYHGGFNGMQARMHDLTRRRVGMGDQSKLWRGEASVKEMLQAKPGDVITRHYPTSWSSDSKVASNFAREPTSGTGFDKHYSRSHPSERVRTVIRNARDIQNVANIDAQGGMLSYEKEYVIGHGAKLRIDKVRDSKAGRVIFATALEHSPEASYRLGLLRRFISPSFQAGRLWRGGVIGALAVAPLASLTHGSLWGTAVPKEQA